MSLHKYNNHLSFLVVLVVVFFSSCTGYPDNAMVIPKNAAMVTVFNATDLYEKADISDIMDLDAVRSLRKQMKREGSAAYDIMKDLMEDPSISGIDFSDDIFLFLINEGRGETYTGISLALSDDTKFMEFLRDFSFKSKMGLTYEEEDDYNYSPIANDGILAWDEDKLLMVTANDYRARKNIGFVADELFGLKETRQISDNDNFNSFYSDRDDISTWVNSSALENDFIISGIQNELGFDLDDNQFINHISFEDGSVDMAMEFIPNDDLQETLDSKQIWAGDFNSDLLSYLPSDQLFFTCASTNTETLFDYISELSAYRLIKKEFQSQGIDLKKTILSLGGNLAFSINGFEEAEVTYMAYGYEFNEFSAVRMDEMFPISLAGELSMRDQELLNNGKTIGIDSYSYGSDFCISIQNVLDEGGDIQSAIENDSEIIWYEGGWEYGPFIEKTHTETVASMSLVMDLANREDFERFLENIPNDAVEKDGDIYRLKDAGETPFYLTLHNEMCLLTNSLNSVEQFQSGGYGKSSLAESDEISSIDFGSFYTKLDADIFMKGRRVDFFRGGPDISAFGIKSIEITDAGDMQANVTLDLKEKDQNSLNYIIENSQELFSPRRNSYYEDELMIDDEIMFDFDEAEEIDWD